jgi:hypothetical protein
VDATYDLTDNVTLGTHGLPRRELQTHGDADRACQGSSDGTAGNVRYREVETPEQTYLSELYQTDTLDRLVRFDRGELNEAHTQVAVPTPEPYVRSQTWRLADGGELDLLGNWLSTRTTIGATVTTDTRTADAANEYLTRQLDTGPTRMLPAC